MKELLQKFDKIFGHKDHCGFHDDYNAEKDGWKGASMIRSAGCDDCGKCQNFREECRNFVESNLVDTTTAFIEDTDKEIARLEKAMKTFGGYDSEGVVYDRKAEGYNESVQDQITHLENKKKELLELMK